jgi:[protein-PII] uridylyltransferase
LPPLLDEVALQSAVAKQDLKALKTLLKNHQEALFSAFRAGAPVETLVQARTEALDTLLRQLWGQHAWAEPVSLVAVGGYGRGELLPYSDIDLLLLFDTEATLETHAPAIQAFITQLWDLNLHIGHSVRSLDSCVAEARDDVTVVTNLLESRLLWGNPELFRHMQAATDAEHLWPSAHFFKAKMNEQTQRYEKFGDIGYTLEPNLKTSPGGLRDIQTIGWVAKRHFRDQRLEQLVERGFLMPSELDTLLDGQRHLWQLRFALHMLSGREEDRLLFDWQKSLAELFGFVDNEQALGVEQLMQGYYRTVFQLRALNELLLQHFDELILTSAAEQTTYPINSRYRAVNGYLELNDPDLFTQRPSALLEIFVVLTQHPELKGLRASTIRQVYEHRHLIGPAFRNDIRNSSYFLELMRSGYRVSTNLRRMNRYGVLGQYLPEFDAVVGKMQFDLIHVYTVDAHSLKTVQNLRQFSQRHQPPLCPLAMQIFQRLPKPDLIYMAGLFHDLGKGRGGDHALIGAELMAGFCRRHRMPDWDTNLMVWLVEHHLLLSRTAQLEDLSEPDVIRRFAEQVDDLVRLDYLYVLTVADIHATNPELWNSWRAALVRQLYADARQMLRRGLDQTGPGKAQRVRHTRQAATELLMAEGFDQAAVVAFLKNPGDDYFLRETPQSIAWQTRAILNQGVEQPLVLVQALQEGGLASATQIFIYAPDRINLFADIASAMDQLQLNIHDARIMTAQDSAYSLDTFIVLEEDDCPINLNDTHRVDTICAVLLEAITQPKPRRPSSRRVPRMLKSFRIPTEVTLSNDLILGRTIVEVVTTDRPGLLARIGEVFVQTGVFLQSARISTLGERVEDVFYVLGPDDQPLRDPELAEQLRITLIETLDALSEPNHA